MWMHIENTEQDIKDKKISAQKLTEHIEDAVRDAFYDGKSLYEVKIKHASPELCAAEVLLISDSVICGDGFHSYFYYGCGGMFKAAVESCRLFGLDELAEAFLQAGAAFKEIYGTDLPADPGKIREITDNAGIEDDNRLFYEKADKKYYSVRPDIEKAIVDYAAEHPGKFAYVGDPRDIEVL